MESIFVQLSVIVLFAVIVSGIMRLLKQPLLIGYIVTGIIAGPYLFNIVGDNLLFETFSQIGVALLLFMVGLHLNPKVIKDVGIVSLVTGLGQIIFTSVIGFFIAKMFGFSNITSLYIAVALTFSSTIIIMKLLSDIKQVDSLFGKISIGFLIVQDLVAIFILMLISSFASDVTVSSLFVGTILKGIIAIALVSLLSYLFLPKLTSVISHSQEFLFLFSVGWCLSLASLFLYMGFSIEIGALLAGVTLSFSPYYQEISSKTKPLRDFFIILFFVILGSRMVIGDITQHITPIIIFSFFILIGNPLIVMIIMGMMGYTKRNGFMAGLTVAQISEFSLILIALGISVGHLSNEILSMVTTIGLITIAGSTYMILYSNKLYSILSPYLSIFEKKKLNTQRESHKNYDAILFGYNRIGFGILRSLSRIKKKYLVVDYNPETIKDLGKLRVPCLYGDVYDVDFIEDLPLDKVQIVVSTIPEFEVNSLLIETVRRVNKNAIIIVRAHQVKDALDLYEEGADYVLTPHFLGGEYISNMIKDLKVYEKGYKAEQEKHIKLLRDLLKRGHEHPEVEKD